MLFRTVTILFLGAILLIATWFGWHWYAIQSVDTEFRSGDLMIRGTLLTPRFTDQTPAVVLVHGSGETSRKSTLLYAWMFASQGAWVVSLAATQVDSPAFLIMESASVSTVAEDRRFGREAQVRHAGFDDKAVAKARLLS